MNRKNLAAFAIFSLGVLAVLAALPLVAGRLGWLSGSTPPDLGVRDGRLKAPSGTPNSVSSQADLHKGTGALVDYARIAPLAGGDDLAATMARLRRVIESMPGARIVQARPDYLYVQFETRVFRFVDDAEFWASPAEGVIHVRSASRLGRGDHGVNRERVEQIRAALDPRFRGDDMKPRGDDTKPRGDDTKPSGDDSKPSGDDSKRR